MYACPSGYTLSGSNCNGSTSAAATATPSCNGHGTLTNSTISSTGTYCLLLNYSYKVYSDPEQNCAALASSFGLVMDPNSSSNGIPTYRCILTPKITYSCPSGATLSGSTCTRPVTQAATVSGYTCSSGTLSGSSCVTSTTSAASASYSCPSGQSLSGTTCTATSTTTVAGTPIYSCPSGYTLSGASCTTQGTATTAATASFICASGTLLGANCLNAVTRTRYEPYGNTAAGSVPRELGFTGHVNDAETGLVQMQQRYYDPLAGRFLSLDPVTTDANTGGMFNRYVYGNNNPYRFTDPDGRLSTGEWFDQWAQDAANRGDRASTFG